MAKPRITIIGLGRTGTSLGLAIKKANSDVELVGHDKESRAGQAAQKTGAFDRIEWNLPNALDSAGLVILAMPLPGTRETIDVLARELVPGVIVTDTAALKTPVLEWAAALPEGVQFVGGHPIISPRRAGDPAGADLFTDSVYCLTPATSAAANAVQIVSTMVNLVGAKALFLDAREHDGLVTGVEHVPYLLSLALLRAATTSGAWRDLSQVAGEDYRRATDLAAEEAEGRRALLFQNREDVSRWIAAVEDALADLREAIDRQDAAQFDEWAGDARSAREAWLKGEVGAAPALDASDLRPSLSRMLLGGLAPRGNKKK
ncbi:MAG: prephenate dehydrogenase [Rudaea sp.]